MESLSCLVLGRLYCLVVNRKTHLYETGIRANKTSLVIVESRVEVRYYTIIDY